MMKYKSWSRNGKCKVRKLQCNEATFKDLKWVNPAGLQSII